ENSGCACRVEVCLSPSMERGASGVADTTACSLWVVSVPLGEPYADQSYMRDCLRASRAHRGLTVAGQSAGLQPLLVRDYPPEFWAGLRRGVCARLKPL